MGKLSRKKDGGAEKGQKKITGFFQGSQPFTTVQSTAARVASSGASRGTSPGSSSTGISSLGSNLTSSLQKQNSVNNPQKPILQPSPLKQPPLSKQSPPTKQPQPFKKPSPLKPIPPELDFLKCTPEREKFKTRKPILMTSKSVKRRLSNESSEYKRACNLSEAQSSIEKENTDLQIMDDILQEYAEPNQKRARTKSLSIEQPGLANPEVTSALDNNIEKNVNEEDLFEDDMFDDGFPEECLEAEDTEVPLASKFNRHKILEIDDTVENQLILILEDSLNPGVQRRAVIKDSWLQTVFNEKDILHLEGDWVQDVININDKAGSVIVNPDILVSGTAVVSALFCLRKAVLAEKYKGGGGGNKVMLVGTLVHELLQGVLETREYSRQNISQLMDSILRSPNTIQELSYLGITELEIRKDISPFLDHIQFFVKKYMLGQQVAAPEASTPDRPKRGTERAQWKGRIARVVDIEENIWSPRLGIKGKIDISVETQGSKKILPLEIKTGKPSFSAEHSGQVMLYSMMSRDRRPDPGSGLLLYLRSSNMVEIPCRRNEERGLLQLRNQLVAYLSQVGEYENEKVSEMILPEPIDFEKACSNCDYLEICSIYQKIQGNVPPPPHPMTRLAPDTLQHLEAGDLAWFHHWSDILRLEAGEMKTSVSNLWTETPGRRERSGSCIQLLDLSSVLDNRTHRFTRAGGLPPIFQAGEVVLLSSDAELALSQGSVVRVDTEDIIVLLDRDISGQPGWKNTKFTLDRHVYQGSMSSNFVAIGKLMSDNPAAKSLRRIIIEKEPVKFLPGLVREVAVTARGVIKDLNKIQQKAIFRCMMTENYSLIRGMPGSGKSTTIVGLIRLLAKLGQSILLVAYTNSAVDTVLCKLKKFETKFLRLGRSARVRDELQEFTADRVCCNITSCDELSQLYKSYNIIATTCLATNHAAIINRTFDWCIIDEASQALLPSVIHPILFSKKFILVGDPAQLPPVVQNHHARKLGLAQSLFERLDCPAATIDLNIQYRMNQTIADLANHLTYKGKLECADESVAQRNLKLNLESGIKPWLSAALSQKQEESVVFLDTNMEAREEPLPGGVRNTLEGHIVLQIVGEARRGGLDETEIAVIAPYAAQVKHLQVVMKKAGFCVEVGTVDQFQGRDSELVIYSCTRSFINSGENEKISAGHILNDERRLNVAITRARSKLVIVGCLETLVREYKPFRNMLSFLENGKTVKLCGEDMTISV